MYKPEFIGDEICKQTNDLIQWCQVNSFVKQVHKVKK